MAPSVVVALLLGSIRRTGSIVWTLPFSANLTLQQTHDDFAIIYECRRRFVKRFAVKKYPIEK